MDGFEMDSGFAISVSSELMAILSVSRDLADMRHRIGEMVVAQDKQGKDVTTADLGVDVASKVKTLKVEPPAERSAGVKVGSVDELVEKLKNEAKVI